jgi:hypothetical protein
LYFDIILTPLADVRIKVKRLDDRLRRSTDQAKRLSVAFNISNTQINFHLTRNEEIRTTVPIYTADENGNIKIQRVSELEVRLMSRIAKVYQSLIESGIT